MKPLFMAITLAGLSLAQNKPDDKPTPTGTEVIERFRQVSGSDLLDKAKTQVITDRKSTRLNSSHG